MRALLISVLPVAVLALTPQCSKSTYKEAGLGEKFSEAIAHAIHSLNAEGLRLFDPTATGQNGIPTVNRNIRSAEKVVNDAPEVPLQSGGFVTPPMKVINAVWAHLGEGDDGLGETWLPVERIVHEFHMRDLWHAIRGVYAANVTANPPSRQTCSCLLDTAHNGIRAKVQWIAEQYKQWTPITLLNKPIPQLTDKASWKVWRDRITHYYDSQSLFDAAMYMYCAVHANSATVVRGKDAKDARGVPTLTYRKVASNAQCTPELYAGAGLGKNFNETIGHAIHSLNADGLRLFDQRMTGHNGVPTVNRNIHSSSKVVDNAPEVVLDKGGFATPPMHVINSVWTHLDDGTDGLGESWLPVERIVHEFHMRDLWHAIHHVYVSKLAAAPPSPQVCGCLLNTEQNGVRSKVQWIAEQYKQWTPITLLNKPIPQLTDKASWNVWRARITHYYDDQSLYDAAAYMYCVVSANVA